MRILDKYVTRKIILSYIFILLSFIGLHIIIDLFTTLSDFLRAKTPVYLVLEYYVYSLPLMFQRTSTFSLPMAILFSIGEFNRDNEVVSMRTSGISILRLSMPIIYFALTLSFLSLFIQEKVLIYSQKKSRDIKIEFVKNKHKENTVRNFVFRSKNQLFFVSTFDPNKDTLKNVIILKEGSSGEIKEKIVCQAIVYKDNQWKAKDIISYQLDREGRIVNQLTAQKERIIDIGEKPQSLVFKKNAFGEYLSIKQLRREIKTIGKSASSTFLNNLIIDYNKKMAGPFGHLFLAIGILPFALEIKKRKVGISAIVGGFIFGFLYYLITSVSIALGKAGVLIPYLSSWVGPLFFLVMGISGLILIK